MMKLLLLGAPLGAVMATEVNPIRRVVTLMQNMQKEIEAEGEKEEELYKKFMCYCKGNNDNLRKAAEEAAATAEDMNAKVKAESAEKEQVAAELKQHKADRADAQQDLEKAMKIREKEAKEFEAESSDTRANAAATASAITALEKGMGASFLQSSAASTLKSVIDGVDSLDERELLTSFLQGDYHSQSGQIVGILKNMKDEMDKSIASIVAAEDEAVASFAELKAAKEKEIATASAAIENKTQRVGELAVSVVQNKNAAKDAAEDFEDSNKFLANLEQTCKDKTADWEERTKTRQEEIMAISEAIAVLNDDDALDVFKASLPSPKVQPQQPAQAFLQKSSTKASAVSKVRSMFLSNESFAKNPALALIAHTITSKLHAKKVDFSSVLKMIDEMTTLLNKEQKDDEKHRDWCNTEFDSSDDEQKATNQKLNSLASAISEMKDEIAALGDQVASLQHENKNLDQSVADATAQRKEEHTDFTAKISLNNAAIQLIFKAKNRLQKFYNPGQYVAAEQREPTEEERMAMAAGEKVDLSVAPQMIAGTQQTVFLQISGPELAAAPETFEGGYEKKGQKSNGIMGLMDNLTKDLEKEIQEAEHGEKTAQRDYDELVADAQKTKKDNSKAITDKSASKADLENKMEDAKANHSTTGEQLAQVKAYIADLHNSCDFIMQNFEARREARTSEVEGLKNAKAVLNGANFA